MDRPGKDFFPAPIDLASLDPAAPNARDLGDGASVVVLVRGKELSVFRDLCPHMGAPLSAGSQRGELLQCPWHGYRFDGRDGRLVENPNDKVFACMKGLYSSYKPEKAPTLRLTAFAYELEGGKAWVRRPGTE